MARRRKTKKKPLTVVERGAMGGKRAAERMTAKQRTERARKAGLANGARFKKDRANLSQGKRSGGAATQSKRRPSKAA